MIIDAVVLFAIVLVFILFNKNIIANHPRKLLKNEIVFIVLIIALIIAAFLFKIYAIKFEWFFPAAWAGVMIIFNWLESETSAEIILYELLLSAVLLSLFMMPFNKFTVYIFAGNFFIFLLMGAAGYKILMVRQNPIPAFFFMLFSVFTLKSLALEYLSFWISVPVCILFAIFFCVRKGETLSYYLEEKNILKILTFLYPLFVIQSFIIVMLKNPFFGL